MSGKRLFLLGVFRRRLEYPALKRAVREQQSLYDANVVLIEDKASGTQLIQELIRNGCHGVTRYQPTLDKVMRLHAQTAMIENGFVHIPPGRFHRPVPGLVQNANAELGHLRGNPQRC